MSEIRSALQGAAFSGAVRIAEAGPRGMVTVKGEFGDGAVREAVAKVAGVAFPEQGSVNAEGARGLCWMAPDEVLMLMPHGEADAAVAVLGKALEGHHFLAANVSDARAVFSLSGHAVRDTLAKLTPADLSPEAMGPGRIRRTRLAQVAAAFWFREPELVEIVCFRSQAVYVFGVLKAAARPGSEVGYH